MNNLIVKKTKGNELMAKIKNDIDDVWKIAYKKPPKLMSERSEDEYRKKIFFLIMENGRVMAVGNLIPVNIVFCGTNCKIYGIADIASRIKRQGYGKILMGEMLEYLEEKNFSAIGFSEQKNREFYLKCGYGIALDLGGRFVYCLKSGKEIKNSGEILYFEGRDKLITRMVNNKKEIATMDAPFW